MVPERLGDDAEFQHYQIKGHGFNSQVSSALINCTPSGMVPS